MIEAPIKNEKNKCPIVVKRVFTVRNDRGLHTRPSTEIVKLTSSFKSEIRLIYQRDTVNAKSLLGILMLAAPRGAKIKIEAVGEDAERAVEELIALSVNKFHSNY